MKISAQDKVFKLLSELNAAKDGITASEIAEKLSLSRQVVSHYLSRLLEEGKVAKTATKPVYWSVKGKMKTEDVFESFIGYHGSQSEIIQRCQAAVKYPPNGLNILITGQSGVGKSFLASLIYQYAINQEVIKKNAPYIVLNCADYADNAELLSSVLFGYKKGAFTGATTEKDGLIQEADGGFLFLDEIHRLSKENQEKLFLFMDTGKYRPLGENKTWNESKVRFIFATTENEENIFLETFLRRIQVHVTISNFNNRPLAEKIQLIKYMFYQEANILQKNILVKGESVQLLLNSHFNGNIGKLKNMIKLSCADAYNHHPDHDTLLISPGTISDMPVRKAETSKYPHNDLLIEYAFPFDFDQEHADGFMLELKKIMSDLHDAKDTGSIASLEQLKNRLQTLHLKSLGNFSYFENISNQSIMYVKNMFIQKWEDIIMNRYGIVNSVSIDKISFDFYYYIHEKKIPFLGCLKDLDIEIQTVYPRTSYIADKFVSSLHLTSEKSAFLKIVISLLLSDYVKEDIELKGLLIAHGESTASSIQSVVNRLCETYVFEAIDMPINTALENIITEARMFIHHQANPDGLILLVDMGSLSKLYSSIKNALQGDLLIVDNLTTSIALDIGLKIKNRVPFKTIAEQSVEKYKIEIQYFEGFSKTKNIIISCMSGMGISEKIKDIMSKYLSTEKIEVLTMEYRELKNTIDRNSKNYFDKTKLVITTTDLPSSFSIPHVNIYNMLDAEGISNLWSLIYNDISRNSFDKMIQELLKLFSIQGVVDRLKFLNPVVVINEVENVLTKYENYYRITFTGKVKLNLYMHIALMIERLFISREEKEDIKEKLSEPEAEFYVTSKNIFKPMENNYNIMVSQYEISLLYQLIGPFIQK